MKEQLEPLRHSNISEYEGKNFEAKCLVVLHEALSKGYRLMHSDYDNGKKEIIIIDNFAPKYSIRWEGMETKKGKK